MMFKYKTIKVASGKLNSNKIQKKDVPILDRDNPTTFNLSQISTDEIKKLLTNYAILLQRCPTYTLQTEELNRKYKGLFGSLSGDMIPHAEKYYHFIQKIVQQRATNAIRSGNTANMESEKTFLNQLINHFSTKLRIQVTGRDESIVAKADPFTMLNYFRGAVNALDMEINKFSNARTMQPI